MIKKSTILFQPYYVKGYEPERCWFRGGYVTSESMSLLRSAIASSDQMGDADIAILCARMNLYEGRAKELAIAKIDYELETAINRIQNNRGIQPEREDEELVVRLLGWEQYCKMAGEIASGRSVELAKSEGLDGRRVYTVSSIEREQQLAKCEQQYHEDKSSEEVER